MSPAREPFKSSRPPARAAHFRAVCKILNQSCRMLSARTATGSGMGILARLFLLLAIALVPTAAIQIYDELDRRQAQEAGLHAEAGRLTRLAGTEQERLFEGSRQLLAAIAQLRPALLQNRDLCGATLGRLATQQQQRYAYVALTDLDGNVLCASARPPRDELAAQQSLIHAAAAGGEFAVGNAIITAEGRRLLPLALPVVGDGGKVSEIALAALSLDWLAANLPANLLSAGAILDLADRAGIVIAELPLADGAPLHVGDALPEPRRALVTRAIAGTLESSDAGGGVRVFGYKPLDAPPAQGVYIEVGLDRDAALAAMDRSTARHGIAAVAALLAGCLLAWLGAHYWIRRPTGALVRAARRWREGDWSARVDSGDSRSEFGRLGHAFDQMAEALARRERQLIEAKEDAEASNRAKSSFLANMSHELRTPLTAIIGFSEVITDQHYGANAGERYRECATYINASGQHLLRLVNDVLDVSKLAAGQLELAESVVDLGALLRECIAVLGSEAQQKKVTIAADIPAALPPLLAGELRLKQVFLNLLSNAVKFSRQGGSVVIAAEVTDAGDLAVRVADKGIGMKAQDIPVALEPFRQIDNALSRPYEGTGLGLPLAKMLVEKHGGTLALDSTLGVGTTVTITLPAARLRPPAHAARASAEAGR
jgi:signal transduction histidine kinase